MTRVDALREMEERVADGDEPFFHEWEAVFPGTVADYPLAKMAEDACAGSVDAAIELLDAVLPGYGFALERGEAAVWHPETRGTSRDIVRAATASRALVTAIIRALIAERQDG